MTEPVRRRVVALLAGQAFAFGLSESLLLIVANAIFLDAYGSKWLPLTYVGIAVVGTLFAAGVARIVRRWPLPRVAILTEAAVALLFLVAWLVLAVSDGAWVSAPLLVLFPVLLQIGFIFVGGQAGRLLDVQQIKAGFPRIVSGFAVGFLAGGLAGSPLLALLGSPDHLLLVAAGSQVGFLALLAVAGRRFADRLGQVESSPLGLPRPPLRTLLATRFVLLIIGYQVLSAAGTYLIEFILFDRAAARYDDAESLTRFLSTYTAALNIVDILFLALFAGVLLRRFGLRLGIAANPLRGHGARGRDVDLRDRLRRRLAGAVRAGGGRAHRRHLVDRRDDEDVHQHRVPAAAGRGAPRRPGGRRGHRRARRHRDHRSAAVRVARPGRTRVRHRGRHGRGLRRLDADRLCCSTASTRGRSPARSGDGSCPARHPTWEAPRRPRRSSACSRATTDATYGWDSIFCPGRRHRRRMPSWRGSPVIRAPMCACPPSPASPATAMPRASDRLRAEITTLTASSEAAERRLAARDSGSADRGRPRRHSRNSCATRTRQCAPRRSPPSVPKTEGSSMR